MASLPIYVERGSFVLAVLSGIVGAVAGGSGWSATSIVAGCLAAAAPVAGRFASQSLSRRAEADSNVQIAIANAKADEAIAELEDSRAKLGPRRLSNSQLSRLAEDLAKLKPFRVTIAHNRREGEPLVLHEQLTSVFKSAGFDVSYYGGMTNHTIGIEVSGAHTTEKQAVMNVLSSAGVEFTPVHFTDGDGIFGGVEIWVGTHPGLGNSRVQ